jgi:hypothetical protein
MGAADPTTFPDQLPGINTHEYAIEDNPKAPTDIAPGEYVLGWRW